MKAYITYGKGNINLYRTYPNPLTNLTPIPESPYKGTNSNLFATDLTIEVFGTEFLNAYTDGDNAKVVPTATMTNFVLRKARDFEGATQESFLNFIAHQLLRQYPIMEAVQVRSKELPFVAAPITNDAGETVEDSDRLYAPSHDSHGFASLNAERSGDEIIVTDHECGRLNMKLMKLTGSAFAGFPQDEYTTLPSVEDRPLYIYLDMGWRYTDVNDAISDDHSKYIAQQQIYDHVRHTFHDFYNMSIQHLVYEMGTRLLDRFPQMSEVWFKAQNQLRMTVAEGQDSDKKVFADPPPPYGMISLKLSRSDVE